MAYIMSTYTPIGVYHASLLCIVLILYSICVYTSVFLALSLIHLYTDVYTEYPYNHISYLNYLFCTPYTVPFLCHKVFESGAGEQISKIVM